MIAKFRKVPVVVEAVRFDGTNTDEIVAFPFSSGAARHGWDLCCLFIDTLEGTMRADPGDWVVKGTKGEVYPVKDDIFREIYEQV